MTRLGRRPVWLLRGPLESRTHSSMLTLPRTRHWDMAEKVCTRRRRERKELRWFGKEQRETRRELESRGVRRRRWQVLRSEEEFDPNRISSLGKGLRGHTDYGLTRNMKCWDFMVGPIYGSPQGP